jgi:hypothetical protein
MYFFQVMKFIVHVMETDTKKFSSTNLISRCMQIKIKSLVEFTFHSREHLRKRFLLKKEKIFSAHVLLFVKISDESEKSRKTFKTKSGSCNLQKQLHSYTLNFFTKLNVVNRQPTINFVVLQTNWSKFQVICNFN